MFFFCYFSILYAIQELITKSNKEIKNKLQVGDKLELIVPHQIETIPFSIDALWDVDTKEEISYINPGKAEQKVLMKLPVKVEKNWILRRKK